MFGGIVVAALSGYGAIATPYGLLKDAARAGPVALPAAPLPAAVATARVATAMERRVRVA